MVYKCEKDFLVRVPFLSFNVFSRNSEKEDIEFLDLINKKNFLSSLWFSSYDLYEALQTNGLKNEKVYNSCLKYMIRASTRCTPFGLNSAVIKGELSNENFLLLDEQFDKFIRPDMSWLSRVIVLLEKNIGRKLKVKTNNTLKYNTYTIENKWKSFYNQTNRLLNDKTIINNTKAVELILEILQNGYSSIEEVIKILMTKYTQIPEDYLMNFIFQLIDGEYIVSNLRAPLTVTNQLGRLNAIIKEYDYEDNLTIFLRTIEENLIKCNSEIVSNNIEFLSNMRMKMKEICESENYLVADMYKKEQFKLNKELVVELEEFCDYLYSWAYEETYSDYIIKFQEAYGNTAVKYLDVIDPDRGIGSPKIDKTNSLRFKDQFTLTFLRAILESKYDNEINIAGMFSEKIHSNRISKDKIELVISFLNNEKTPKYFVSQTMSYGGIGSISGRFRYLFTDTSVDTERGEKEDLDVDIVYPSFNAKHANIQIAKPYTQHILNYGFNDYANYSNHIDIDDVYVYISHENKLEFVSKKHGKKLNFTISNAYNQHFCPRDLRPIIELVTNQRPDIGAVIKELNHIISNLPSGNPRIVFNNIMLFPQGWKCPDILLSKDKLNDFKLFSAEFKKFKEQNHIPDIIVFGEQDMKLTINLNNNRHLIILNESLKKNPKLILFESLLNNEEGLIKNQDGEVYCNEFVFTFNQQVQRCCDNKVTDIVENYYDFEKQHENSYIPFTKWIYFKIYAEKSSLEKIIINELIELNNMLYQSDLINSMFYIRYMDPKDHLRIRIDFKVEKINECLDIIIKLCNKLWNESKINNVIFDTYNQESDRYGSYGNIELAEKLFSVDSTVTMNLLKNKSIRNNTQKLIELYIISAYHILLAMEISLEDVLKYLDNFRLTKSENDVFRKLDGLPNLQQMVNTDLLNMRDNQETLNIQIIMDERNRAAYLYWKNVCNTMQSFNSKRDILISILHMHFNRLIGIDRRLENLSNAYLRKILFIKFNSKRYSR